MGNVLWGLENDKVPYYGLIQLVGSKQILSLWFPDLSFDSTNTKLLIQGVASVTGFNTPACSILSISCLNVSFRCMGTGLQGICFSCTLGSRCMVYGGPGNLPISSKTSGQCFIIGSLLVIFLWDLCCFVSGTCGESCALDGILASAWEWLCADSCLELCICTGAGTCLVFLGWSYVLAIRACPGRQVIPV